MAEYGRPKVGEPSIHNPLQADRFNLIMRGLMDNTPRMTGRFLHAWQTTGLLYPDTTAQPFHLRVTLDQTLDNSREVDITTLSGNGMTLHRKRWQYDTDNGKKVLYLVSEDVSLGREAPDLETAMKRAQSKDERRLKAAEKFTVEDLKPAPSVAATDADMEILINYLEAAQPLKPVNPIGRLVVGVASHLRSAA